MAAPDRTYYVYITSSLSRRLHIGVTDDLVRRLGEHRDRTFRDSFARRDNTRRLVYFEATHAVRAAIAREKELKGWRRAKKRALIERFNPRWRDLGARWPDIELP